MALFAPQPQTKRPDFATHLKYVSLLSELGKGVNVSCHLTPQLNKSELAKLREKLQLIELTKKSIMDEYAIVKVDREYSTASVIWLPIKSYYLAYHLLCIIDYLITGNQKSLTTKHSICVDSFTAKLKSGSLQFSEPLLNNVYDSSVLSFKTSPGTLLRSEVDQGTAYKLLMKKIAKDKIKNHMVNNGIDDLKSKSNKDKLEKFKSKLTVSIFDFFYLMRLRLNYRDLDFIDDISALDTETYFEMYYRTAGHFYSSFNRLKNNLVAQIEAK